LFGICAGLFWLLPLATAGPGGDVEKKVALLDSEKFEVRERATVELLKLGRKAMPALKAASKTGSAEQRVRASKLLQSINHRYLEAGFRDLGNAPDSKIEVEHGMWLLAQLLDPELEKESIDRQLDEMAAAVTKKIGKGVEASSLEPRAAVGVLVDVLKNDFGLHGDEVTYDHPDNSSIHRVLERKKGLPIILSEIAVAVGKRAGLPVVGVGFPGRYMFKYEAPDASESILIDPHGGWTTQTRESLKKIASYYDAEDLEPSTPRETIDRMMNNFQSDSRTVGQSQRAAVADRLQELFGEGAVLN